MCKYDTTNYIYILFPISPSNDFYLKKNEIYPPFFEMIQKDGKKRPHKEGCIDYQLGGYL